MYRDKFQILRDLAKSNNKPDKTIYEYVKEVLDMNTGQAKENRELKKQLSNDHQIKKQQKEFIEWLDNLNIFGQISVKELIDKYNETIGYKE